MNMHQIYFIIVLICILNIHQTALLMKQKKLANKKMKLGILWLIPILGWLYIVIFEDTHENIEIKRHSNSNLLKGEVKYNTAKYFSLFFAIIIYGYIFLLLGS